MEETPGRVQRNPERGTSPIAEEEEEDDNMVESTIGLPNGERDGGDLAESEEDGQDAEDEDNEGDDDETTTTIPIPRIYPPLPRPAASQPSSSFPGLSTLPREILRQGRGFGASQPLQSKSSVMGNGHVDGNGAEEESEESSSDDDSDDVKDKKLAGRYANGRSTKKKVVPVKRSW
jgi:serine/arginine repetitive matrix protein 2